MAQPTPYDRQTSFSAYSAENPGEPAPGSLVDAEFNAVKTALDETQDVLNAITDDDGALARGSVGRAQLDSSITLGFSAPAQWHADTVYDADASTVFYLSVFYICIESHTSTASFDAAKWEEIADLTAAAAIADGDITTDKLADGGVTTDKLAALAVTNAKMASNSVGTSKIQDMAVTTAKLNDGAVTSAKIAPQNVTATEIADLAVVEAKIRDAAVTVNKLAANAVTAPAILNGEITKNKLNTNIRATQAEVEAGIAPDVFVSPALLRNHPGIAKAWAIVTISGGTATLVAGYNINNVVRTSAGVTQINFSAAFADGNYAAVGNLIEDSTSTATDLRVGTRTATACVVNTYTDTNSGNTTRVATDHSFMIAMYGDF